MTKPKAITRAITLLLEAPGVTVNSGGSIHDVMDRREAPPGRYRLVSEEDVQDMVASLKRADARTRLDPSQRKRRPSGR